MKYLIVIFFIIVNISLPAKLFEAPFKKDIIDQIDDKTTVKNISAQESDTYAVEKFNKAVKIEPGSLINIENISGNIRIIRWDKEFVEISAIKTSRRGKSSLQYIDIFINNKKDLNIETRYNSENLSASVDYVIKIPQNILIGKINTEKGKVSIKE